MVINVVTQSKFKIAAICAISALAGAANIWLMALINKNIRQANVDAEGVVVFSIVLVSMVSISFLSQILLSRLSAKTFFNLRDQLVRGITNLSSQQIESIGSHRLYAALTKDVPAIHELIIVLPNYVFNFTVVIACAIYLGTVSVKLFGVFLVFLLMALFVSKFAIADRAEKKFKLRRKVEDDLFRCYEAVIDGNKELKLNVDREKEFVDQDMRHHAEQYRQVTLSAETLWNMSSNWSSAMIFVGIGSLLFLSPYIGVTDRTEVTSFIIVIFYMVGPLTILMNSFRTIYNAKVGMAKLKDLSLSVPEADRGRELTTVDKFESLSIKDVSFIYDNNNEGEPGFRVGPLNLDISRGEVVFFVGGNGSGKTTAAKLVTGLYEKQGGTIFINGEEVIDEAAYFQNFSAIYQNYYLFETLVPKGGLKSDDDEARALLDRLGLSEKVSVNDGRISTTKLSFGQRKRLALLVAFFDDSQIYVFDEWAADQDPEFREFFYKEFLSEFKHLGKTVIVVSHDERYFHLADKVVKFEGGKIVSTIRAQEQRPVNLVSNDLLNV